MIVLYRLADQVTLVEVTKVREADVLDLRAFQLYADGHIDVLEIFNARRGTGSGEWQEIAVDPLPVVEVASAPEPPEDVPVIAVPIAPPMMPTALAG